MLNGTKNKIIKLGIVGRNNYSWMGGVNYIKNLITAVKQLSDKEIEPVLILGTNADKNMINEFTRLLPVIQSSIFNDNSFLSFLSKGLYRYADSTFLLKKFLLKNKIDVLSHYFMTNKSLPSKTITWIPDFQFLHYPELFPEKEVKRAFYHINKQIKSSDIILLSSFDAKNDLLTHFDLNEFQENKIKILHFVCPQFVLDKENKEILLQLQEKYSFKGKYFFLPNQFWKHKNHLTVFKAVDYLKKNNLDIQLICTGNLKDFRNQNHINELKTYIISNKLENNIKILGNVPYQDVLNFIRYSISTINPSLFEGWSSTVEECKSMGKNMILSSINVHKEQNPPQSIYFEPTNVEMLAEILKGKWQKGDSTPDFYLEQEALKSINERIHNFAKNYISIVKECYFE